MGTGCILRERINSEGRIMAGRMRSLEVYSVEVAKETRVWTAMFENERTDNFPEMKWMKTGMEKPHWMIGKKIKITFYPETPSRNCTTVRKEGKNSLRKRGWGIAWTEVTDSVNNTLKMLKESTGQPEIHQSARCSSKSRVKLNTFFFF